MTRRSSEKRGRQPAKRSQIITGNQRAILLMTCLFVAVLVVLINPKQILAWLFLVVMVLAIVSQTGDKNLAKIKRILKAIADLLK